MDQISMTYYLIAEIFFSLQAFLALTVREREATLLVSRAASGQAKSGQVQATGPRVRGGGGWRWGVSAGIPQEVG